MTSTGVKVWVDRFDTGLVDLVGTGGLFAQVNGRNSAAVIAWPEAQDPEWPAAITHVSMDTSATYARAARIALTQPETPDTLRVHPRITPSANQDSQSLSSPKTRYGCGGAISVNTRCRSMSRNLVQVGSSRANSYSGWSPAGPTIRAVNSCRSTARAFSSIGFTC